MKEIKFYSMRDAQMQRGQLNLAFKNLDDARQWLVDKQDDIKACYTDGFGWSDEIFDIQVFKDVFDSRASMEISLRMKDDELATLKIFEKNEKVEDIDENEDRAITKVMTKDGDIEYYNAYSLGSKLTFKSLESLYERICLDAKDSPYMKFFAKGERLENGGYEDIPIFQFRGRLPIYKVIESGIKDLDLFSIKYFADGHENTIEVAKRVYMW